MPKYMIVQPVFIPAVGDPSAAQHFAGEIVQYDGPPATGMLPMDAEAHAAKQAALKYRKPVQRMRISVTEQRGRRGLPRHLLRELAKAEAAFLGAVQ